MIPRLFIMRRGWMGWWWVLSLGDMRSFMGPVDQIGPEVAIERALEAARRKRLRKIGIDP